MCKTPCYSQWAFKPYIIFILYCEKIACSILLKIRNYFKNMYLKSGTVQSTSKLLFEDQYKTKGNKLKPSNCSPAVCVPAAVMTWGV